MEIITYIIEGAIEHRDDMGNTGVIRPGEIQRMSAGTGVRHSEYNPSKKDSAHLLQLWIMPAVQHLKPSWEQKSFSLADRSGKIVADCRARRKQWLARANSARGAVQIHQDAKIYTSLLAPGQSTSHQLAQGRRAYIFMIGGNLKLNSETLGPGDQARVTSERELELAAPSEEGAAAADSFSWICHKYTNNLPVFSLCPLCPDSVYSVLNLFPKGIYTEGTENLDLCVQFVARCRQAIEPLPQHAVHGHKRCCG